MNAYMFGLKGEKKQSVGDKSAKRGNTERITLISRTFDSVGSNQSMDKSRIESDPVVSKIAAQSAR